MRQYTDGSYNPNNHIYLDNNYHDINRNNIINHHINKTNHYICQHQSKLVGLPWQTPVRRRNSSP
jgi:hypothetical protein